MRVTVEIDNPAILELLQPLIDLATAYHGHMNWSYSHGLEHMNADIYHRDRLVDILRACGASEYFLIGCGSSHIWVAPLAAPDCAAAGVKYATADDGGWPIRFLLITDAD